MSGRLDPALRRETIIPPPESIEHLPDGAIHPASRAVRPSWSFHHPRFTIVMTDGADIDAPCAAVFVTRPGHSIRGISAQRRHASVPERRNENAAGLAGGAFRFIRDAACSPPLRAAQEHAALGLSMPCGFGEARFHAHLVCRPELPARPGAPPLPARRCRHARVGRQQPARASRP